MAEVCSRRWPPPICVTEATELLQELIRLDTANPPGNETKAAELLRAYLEDAGVECELYARVPDRANLVARLHGGRRARACSSSATPTRCSPIPASGRSTRSAGELPRRPRLGPRRARHEEPRGRERGGARDAGARGLPAGAATLSSPPPPTRRSATTGYGLSWLCDEHPDAVRADYCVNEGGGDRVDVDGRPVYLCATAEKMSSPFLLRVHGRSGHASMPGIADNALVKAAALIERLAALEPERRMLPETEALHSRSAGDLDLRSTRRSPRWSRPMLALTIAPTMIEASHKRERDPGGVRGRLRLPAASGPDPGRGARPRSARCLGEGDYELEWIEGVGGTRSALHTPLWSAIRLVRGRGAGRARRARRAPRLHRQPLPARRRSARSRTASSPCGRCRPSWPRGSSTRRTSGSRSTISSLERASSCTSVAYTRKT